MPKASGIPEESLAFSPHWKGKEAGVLMAVEESSSLAAAAATGGGGRGGEEEEEKKEEIHSPERMKVGDSTVFNFSSL